MLKKLYKPYYYIVILFSLLIMLFYIKEHSVDINLNSFDINLNSLLFILITIAIEYSRFFHKSISGSSLCFPLTVSIIIIFGPITAIFTNSIIFIIRSFNNNNKNRIKINILERIHKLFFNVSQGIISVYISERLMYFLNINLENNWDLWKIMIVMLAYYYCNISLVTIILTFMNGKFSNDLLSIRKNYYIFSFYIILTPVLVFNYYDRGFIGLLFILLNVYAMEKALVVYKKWKEQQEELFKDELTGAYNYRYLTSVIDNNISTKKEFAFIMIDIDEFKEINDTYGCLAANKVLKKLVISIKEIIKDDGILCRYGGDKFSIILDSEKEAFDISSKILLLTNEFININEDNKLKIDISIGYYCYTGDAISKEELIDKADKAMFKAKKSNLNVKICQAI